MSADLVEFLNARIDEDEQIAKRGSARRRRRMWHADGHTVRDAAGVIVTGRQGNDTEAEHIARHDPARVLADVAAKRKIIAEHRLVPGEWRYRGIPAADPSDPRGCYVCMHHDGIIIAGGPCTTLFLLASVYADHEDYREEWKP